jgi:MFS family permease
VPRNDGLVENAQPELFKYGYVIVLASFVIFMMSLGIHYCFGVFLKPVLNEFGWTRAAISGAYSLNMILAGALGIVAGRLSDKIGPRIVLTVGGILIGLGYLLMSRVTSIWQIYLFFGVLVSVGEGGMFVPLMSTVARWFVKGRGLVSGIAVSGVAFGIIVMPLLSNLLISNYSWRTSYIVLGFTAIVSIGIVAQFMKRAPNQQRNTEYTAREVSMNTPSLQVRGLSLWEALRTRRFLTACVIFLFFGFGVHTIMVHIVAHATDIGFSPTTAAMVLSITGFVSAGGKIAMGGLGDKIGNRNTVIIICILAALAFLWLRFAGELWMLYLFAIVFGISYGGFSTLQSPLIADLFGLRSHGAIFGSVAFAGSVGSALGSLVAGRIFDITGSYNWAFTLCVILLITSLILTISLKAARKEVKTTGSK